jgi:CRISPR system Cascade subunit CasC
LRTRRLLELITQRLVTAGKDQTQARQVAETALTGWGLGLKGEGRTEYLIFLGDAEVSALADACLANWDHLVEAAGAVAPEAAEEKKTKKKTAKAAMPEDFPKVRNRVLDGGKAVDLALFGRMLADLPERSIDAACQVAHALSTNKISMEFDFYTAVDDLQPQEETGAGMMGTIEFNSACFYRYANLDLNQLAQNLGGDVNLAKKAVTAFLEAAVKAVPTGKQTSMAAQNPPSFVFAVVRDHGLWSLANAFADPVRPGPDSSLVQKSVAALEDYWHRLATVYGDDGIRARAALAVDGPLTRLQDSQVTSLPGLLETVIKALAGQTS